MRSTAARRPQSCPNRQERRLSEVIGTDASYLSTLPVPPVGGNKMISIFFFSSPPSAALTHCRYAQTCEWPYTGAFRIARLRNADTHRPLAPVSVEREHASTEAQASLAPTPIDNPIRSGISRGHRRMLQAGQRISRRWGWPGSISHASSQLRTAAHGHVWTNNSNVLYRGTGNPVG